MAQVQGRLITLEGPDGSGKSTLARLLGAALRRRGLRVTVTREPGGSPLTRRIRSLLLDVRLEGLHPGAELLLFAADRRQHVADTLEPALKRGEWVVCDRFTDSTLAYQGARRRVPGADLERLARFAAGGLVPDLTLLLDLPPEEGLRRAGRGRAGLDRMERSRLEYLGRVRRAFLALARRDPGRIRTIRVRDRTPREVCALALRLVDALAGAP